MSDFQFDVAFSFHSLDEPLAIELNDLLQDRFKTFLYSKHQDKLAGTDGEATFNSVFGEQTRLVVVLCRKEWGETPFTRFEMTAIRNRGFSDGYDFTFFIPTDLPPTVPKWLPKNRLYWGLKRFGVNGAAAAIEARIQETGGEPTVETLADRAARLARDVAAAQQAKLFRRSPEGVNAAEQAFRKLIVQLELDLKGIEAMIGPGRIHEIRGNRNWYMLAAGRAFATIIWRSQYSNDLDDSELVVEFYDGPPNVGAAYTSYREAKKLKKLTFDYELFRAGAHGYQSRDNDKRQFDPSELSEFILKVCLDVAATIKRD